MHAERMMSVNLLFIYCTRRTHSVKIKN